MAITYRMHNKRDEPALIRLWSEHGGWDRIDPETWAERLLRPPVGEASLAVAEDEAGAITGQFAFIPSLVWVGGREVKALRPFAPIVTRELSRASRSLNPLAHPVPRMYLHAIRALKDRGVGLVYMLPDPRWMLLFRVAPFIRRTSFPLWSFPLPLPERLALGDGVTAAPLIAFDDRVDRLWEKARALHGCTVVRDSRTLPWKVGVVEHSVLGVERAGELIGLVASRRKGDRQWLVDDLLAADDGPSLRATLSAVVNLAHAEALASPPESPIRKVAALVTPVMEPAAQAVGFRRDDYDFHLVVQCLDTSLPADAVDPARWYISPND
jgi:hypothetical protein